MLLLTRTYRTSIPTSPKGRNRPLEETEEPAEKRKKPSKFKGPKLSNVWVYVLSAVGVILLVFLALRFADRMPVKEIQVDIHATSDNAFLTDAGVLDLLGLGDRADWEGVPMSSFNLQGMERELVASPFIQSAEVYTSLSGLMKMEVEMRVPVARLLNQSGNYIYLDQTGVKMPKSNAHTAYSVLVSGDFEEAIADTFACSTIPSILPVLNFIQQDTFWSAQISELQIHQDGTATLYPEIGDIKVDFGYPVRIEEKFSNLLDFYRQVLPESGWRTYREVSVRYRGQVVARKR
ncbi:hypothetical protein [Pontibacter sp. G13]|uniref:cell division protein FtsQ/DivIB n=1 Tax=Pontibacter sp. G13 TaxID=3074898 RepID=UPI00288ADB0C|nr:hypothetical protein [Pontibacter sp. G13]WNJ20252.1 hypothetical protein RJD25_07215 [Pontibacter sp. G13]